jgi:serine/threonine protein kinase
MRQASLEGLLSRWDPDGTRCTARPIPYVLGYEIEAFIGEGAMGTVWRAVQLATGRTVALKLMSAAAFGSERARLRFEREIELTETLLSAISLIKILARQDRGPDAAPIHAELHDVANRKLQPGGAFDTVWLTIYAQFLEESATR